MERIKDVDTIRKMLIQFRVLYDEWGNRVTFNKKKFETTNGIINVEYFDYGVYNDNTERMLNRTWFTQKEVDQMREKKKLQFRETA